jgi:penicillin-binding protein 1C
MKKKYLTGLAIAGMMLIILIAIYFITPDITKNLNNYGKLVLDREGKILQAYLNEDEQWCFAPGTESIPFKLKKAVLLYEDRYFYLHPGFNPIAIIRAFIRNIAAGRIVSGGSTISMQLCRIANPGRRTLTKKISELCQAVKLEIRYSKAQILTLYLNNAPYGGNIVGYRAASLRYFNREPDALSWAEAALLAVLPNAPGMIAPGKNQATLQKKRNVLVQKLFKNGDIDETTFQLSCLEPVPESRNVLPSRAPHLARLAAIKSDKPLVYTTIDSKLQNLVETSISFRSAYLHDSGIKNLAALVIDNQTLEILVWLGSQDFSDDSHSGQVDGVIAQRSPGSTLKPLLYALSIDDGLIVPQTMLQDVPSYYPGFQPQNATKSYDGWVRADNALVRSLNVPAVRLLNMYGFHRFYNFLEDANISTLFRSSAGYGLTLVIGGNEVTMLELAALYAGLANYGRFAPLIFMKEQKTIPGSQLISPGSCWQILNILSELKRPGSEYYWQQYDNQWRFAWKTGTSYGHRDAWAVGANPQYTIAVWAGNFDNETNPALSGASSAAPLLFTIFNALPKDASLDWFLMPLNEMQERIICAQTGLAPSSRCPRDTILVSRQAKPLKLCNYHQPFQVTLDGKHTVCSSCWQDTEHTTKIYLVYPPQAKKYLIAAGRQIQNIPPHRSSCPARSHNILQIDYPLNGSLIYLPRNIDLQQQKLTPEISGYARNSRLFWYLDDEFIGISKGREDIPLLPESGSHTLTIIDDEGNSASTHFHITLPE